MSVCLLSFKLCLFVCWLVCHQDYTKTPGRTTTTLELKMDQRQEQTQLTFGADTDKGSDPGIFLSLSLTLRDLQHFCCFHREESGDLVKMNEAYLGG